jgi:hypothetical protein
MSALKTSLTKQAQPRKQAQEPRKSAEMLSKLLQIDDLTHVNPSSRRAYYKWIRDSVDGLQQRTICAKAHLGPLVTARDGRWGDGSKS